jgi:hypothetical protein
MYPQNKQTPVNPQAAQEKPAKLKRARGAKLRAMLAGLIPVPHGYVDPRKEWSKSRRKREAGAAS